MKTISVCANIVFCILLCVHSTSNFLKAPEDVKLKSILADDYEKFVKELGSNIKDSKFRAAIRSLAKAKKVNHKNIDAQVVKLIPTQNEIDVDKSLSYPLKNEQYAREYLFCKSALKVAGSLIVTSDNGKYVIDGHHRWSQVASINNKCLISALDLTDITDPIKALKGTQLGIAAGHDANGNEISEIPSLTVQGNNLLKISKQDLKKYVIENIQDAVVNVFTQFNNKLNTKEIIAEYIWKNVYFIQMYNRPVKGAPARKIMPQTDLSKDWADNVVKI
jgi:hypothetical protein